MPPIQVPEIETKELKELLESSGLFLASSYFGSVVRSYLVMSPAGPAVIAGGI